MLNTNLEHMTLIIAFLFLLSSQYQGVGQGLGYCSSAVFIADSHGAPIFAFSESYCFMCFVSELVLMHSSRAACNLVRQFSVVLATAHMRSGQPDLKSEI